MSRRQRPDRQFALRAVLLLVSAVGRTSGGEEPFYPEPRPAVWLTGTLLIEETEPLPEAQGITGFPPDLFPERGEIVMTVIEVGGREPDAPESSDSRAAATGEPLGQAPPDITQIFLRQASSLLPRGMAQYEIGFTYLFQEADALVLLPGNVLDMQRIRDRRFLMPLTVRYGLGEKTELFGTLPVGLSYFERLDAAGRAATTRGGLGDAGAGFLHQWVRESEAWPDVISSVSFTAPTGSDPYAVSPNVAALGTGFWTVSSSLNLVRSFDPIVLYGGMGYRHEFGRQFRGVDVQPGETLTYSWFFEFL